MRDPKVIDTAIQIVTDKYQYRYENFKFYQLSWEKIEKRTGKIQGTLIRNSQNIIMNIVMNEIISTLRMLII